MEAHKLSSTSWHLFLANFGLANQWDKLEAGDRTDICSYIRRVLLGLFKLSLLVFGGIGIVSFVGYTIGNLIGWLFLGYTLSEATGVFWTIIVIMTLIVTICVLLQKTKEKISDIRYKNRHERKKQAPGFLVLAYRKFKSKTCFMVEVE